MKYDNAYQGGVMSFADIGKAMGITMQGAQYLYRSGMAKLQKGWRLKRVEDLLRTAIAAGRDPGIHATHPAEQRASRMYLPPSEYKPTD